MSYNNPLETVSFDPVGRVIFSGNFGNTSGVNSGEFSGQPRENSGFNTENENILFLKNELSRENIHEFIVYLLESAGKKHNLKSLESINEKYKYFYYTTGEIRDLLFELGMLDFVLNWNLSQLKRGWNVYKGFSKMAVAVLVEIKEKKNKPDTATDKVFIFNENNEAKND